MTRRGVATTLLSALLLSTLVNGFHRKTDRALQVTPNGAGNIANATWSGFRFVVFDTDADILGTGSEGR